MAASAPVRVIGPALSTCTMRVILTGFELGHPVELVKVDMAKGEHKKPEHLKHQPFGKVPAAEDGDLAFYESRAICRYLVDKYAADSKVKLIPADIKKRALFEQWMSLEATTYTPEVTVILKNFFASKYGGSKDEAACATAAANLKRDGPVFNAQLEGRDWIIGEFSLVDICMFTYMFPIASDPGIKQWFADYPNIGAWFNRMQTRESFKQLLPLLTY